MPNFVEYAGSLKLSEQLKHLIDALEKMPGIGCLMSITHGIEKESLRVDKQGRIALSPHPSGLGSPLTHEFITTDFSEALIEFITPVFTDPASSLEYLEDIHRFLYSQLEDGELLWTSSMPCIIEEDDQIPLAQYGTSNIGKLKTLYRRGLGHRYTRAMQTIAGIHYNFSLPDEFWQLLHDSHESKQDLQDFKTDQYFNLIRNFRRYSWLLIYLFGASPAVCKSFIKDRTGHGLDAFDDYTYYMPYGTSLRMGDLGYTSDAQTDLFVSYNSLDEYIEGMRNAIKTPYAPYAEFDKLSNEHQQINNNILQIENEFYSTIRPKRVSKNGERPIHSLKNDGVEYIEVRCLDLNPFLPTGIDETQINFLNAFLLFCLLRKSPPSSKEEYKEIQNNFSSVVNEGRKPGLCLSQNNEAIPLSAWAGEILQESLEVAELLDNTNNMSVYQGAVKEQLSKVENSELTPSAQVLAYMREHQTPYFPFALKQSQNSAEYLHNKLSKEKIENFEKVTEQSNRDREHIEQSDKLGFDEFLIQTNLV
ncbi:MAG: glutamate--cysteine ligase [SAR86 cluster bacterium]|uniref:Glutamate--cysteine ligase n=1 Tax=SAR86 cluster bacterium TaxID=2030880 RepID=A0A2A5CIJ9_9GAMM|nr:MAG: glutamate--cysteine ligase [SAR86 cluster bacterium]